MSLGFEDVIQVHFAIQREAIMKQLSQWVKEVISPEHERKRCCVELYNIIYIDDRFLFERTM